MNAAFAIEGLFAALLCLTILYGPWQSACADHAKQRLFGARDELFRLGEAGQLSFDHPTYVRLRAWINLLIRFSPAVSLVRIAVHRFFVRSQTPGVNDPRSLISSGLPPEVRDRLHEIVTDCEQAIAFMAVLRSPLVWIALLLAMPMAALMAPILGLRHLYSQLVKRLAQAVENEALSSEDGAFA